MKKNTTLFFVLICTLVLSTQVRGEILGELHIARGALRDVTRDNIHFTWNVQDREPVQNILEEWDLFGPFYEEDFGQTKIASSETPGFNSIVEWLTNGKDDVIYTKLEVGENFWWAWTGSGWLESRDIHKYVESYGPDFYGYDITEISMTLDKGIIEPRGDWTYYAWDKTYRFYGERVPEPTTLFLLAVGGMFVRKPKK